MKIDVFPHILPARYHEELVKKGKKSSIWENPAVSQLDIRFRLMERSPDVLQVLTLVAPALEMLVSPAEAVELARIANDEMAELVLKYPNRFVAAVACLPLADIDASLKEAERTITQLRFRGIQIFTHINREPLHLPKFRPLYELMARYDLPIWIHPTDDPRYDPKWEWINPLQNSGVLGWPYQTSLAMIHLVESGIFEDFPNIKFITHHCGGMVPSFEQRIWGINMMKGPEGLIKFENLRKFYNDTAVYGSTSALMCGHAFFGADHIVFGTDMPLGGNSYGFSLDTIRSVEQMDIPSTDKEKIFWANARKLLKLWF